MRKALGLIETRGLVGAIEAVDVACKTSEVEVLNKHLVKGGIVTVEIVGDIGAVKVAVEAAAEMTKRLGVYIGSHVIPRPDDDVYDMLIKKEVVSKELESSKELETIEVKNEEKEIFNETIKEIEDELKVNIKNLEIKKVKKNKK